MEIIQKWQEELEKINDHDCHLSPEDGCEACERIAWLKNRLATVDERKEDFRVRESNRVNKLVVEADCDGVYFNKISL